MIHILNLGRRILNLIYPKISKNAQNLHCFFLLLLSFFSTPILCMNFQIVSDLSIDNIVRLGLDNIKINNQDAIKKVLTKKSENTQNSVVSSNFSSLICLKHDRSPQPVNTHYSRAFKSIFFNHFSILKCLDLAEHQFSSNILLQFPDLGILYICAFGKIFP